MVARIATARAEPPTPSNCPERLAKPKKRPRFETGMTLASISCHGVATKPLPKAFHIHKIMKITTAVLFGSLSSAITTSGSTR